LIHIYTGNGKGKTTSCLGLALRAQGAGLKVFIGQFLKCGNTSELNALKHLKGITIEQYGRKKFIKPSPCVEDIKSAETGLCRINKIVAEKKHDLVILDEINIALHFKILKLNDVMHILKSAPKTMDLVLTGRNAPKELLEIADLVSEIKEIKHYYKNGKKARKGIEF